MVGIVAPAAVAPAGMVAPAAVAPAAAAAVASVAAVAAVAALAAGMVATAVRMLGRVAPTAEAAAMVVVPAAAVGMVATVTEPLGMVAPTTLVAEVVRLGHHEDLFQSLSSPPPAPPRFDIVGRGIAPRRAPAARFSRARVRPDLSDSVSLGGPPPTGALLPGAPPAPAPASAPLALPRPTGAAATNGGATEPAPPAERSSEVARRAPKAAAPRGLYSTQRSDKRGGLGGGVLPEASTYITRHACKRRTNSSTPSSLARPKPARCGRRSVRAFFEGVGAASLTSMASPLPRAAPDLAGATASTPVVAADSGSDTQPPAVVGVPPVWDVAAAVSAPAVADGSRGAAPTAGGAAPPVPPALAGSSPGGGEDSCHGLRTRWYRKPGGKGGSGGNGAASADFEGGESGMAACRVARRTAQRQQWTHSPSKAKKGGSTAVAERATESGHVQRTPLPVLSPHANSRTSRTEVD